MRMCFFPTGADFDRDPSVHIPIVVLGRPPSQSMKSSHWSCLKSLPIDRCWSLTECGRSARPLHSFLVASPALGSELQETGERDAVRLIDGAAGASAQATVLSTDPWTARMQIVDRMRSGRVFLAGDAAHLNPPFGGHGLNTGLGDAVDLGWKLAAVLDGWGGPALLDSYQIERRPIQERVIREATANMAVTSRELLADNLEDDDAAGERARRAAGERIQQTKRAEFHSLELVLGIAIADSPVIIRPGAPTGDFGPGTLLPHAWLGAGRVAVRRARGRVHAAAATPGRGLRRNRAGRAPAGRAAQGPRVARPRRGRPRAGPYPSGPVRGLGRAAGTRRRPGPDRSGAGARTGGPYLS